MGSKSVSILVVIATAALPSSCSRKEQPAKTPNEAIAARVGEGSILLSTLHGAVGQLARESENRGVPPPSTREVLDRLIDEELLLQAAVAAGHLAEDRTARERLISLYVGRQAEAEDLSPTPERLKSFFEANRQRFGSAERLRLRQMLVRVRPGASGDELQAAEAKAEMARQEVLKDPKAFGTVAARYSDDPTSAQGGELGTMPIARWAAYFGDDVGPVLAKLKPGEISTVYRSIHGYHVIQVLSRLDAGVDPVGALGHELLSAYLGDVSARQRSTAAATLRKSASISVDDAAVATVGVKPPSADATSGAAEAPGTATAGGPTPGSMTPGSVMPGSTTPGNAIPGTATPGAAAPPPPQPAK